jgi:hypothetical protein
MHMHKNKRGTGSAMAIMRLVAALGAIVLILCLIIYVLVSFANLLVVA